jgi:hypothetical protein
VICHLSYVACDQCWASTEPAETADEAAMDAGSAGWFASGQNFHLCPACRAKHLEGVTDQLAAGI